MLPLPPVDYVRVDGCAYSIDPMVIGRFVDVTASLTQVRAYCNGDLVAVHDRCWAKHAVITDPVHQATAAKMRQGLAQDRQARRAARQHPDGHVVPLRALPDYDVLLGVDFTAPDRPDGTDNRSGKRKATSQSRHEQPSQPPRKPIRAPPVPTG